MSAKIHTLPVWKEGTNVAEWFEEMAALARSHPDQFSRVIVVAEQFNPENLPTRSRLYSKNYGCNTVLMGSLAVAQHQLWDYMNDRS